MNVEEIERTLEPWGLHDAVLEKLTYDLTERMLQLDLRVMVNRDQSLDRRGRLSISGVDFVSIDPTPSSKHLDDSVVGWVIDSVDPATCPGSTPEFPGSFRHAFFLREANSFLKFSAKAASFEWIESEAREARSSRRALFPGDHIPTPE